MRRRLTTAAAFGTLLILAGCSDSGVPSDEQATTTEDLPGAGPGPAGEDDTAGDPGVGEDDTAGDPGTDDPAATATFLDPDGEERGTVELAEHDGATELSVQVDGLEPGFHGLHVHGIGLCEPDSANPDDPQDTGDFMSAGPHLNPQDTDHGDHPGDLPSLLVTDAGDATLTFVTDRFTVEDLRDEDGAAVMIHSDPDNFAHIPERYGETDEDTLGTGDAGDRVACAVVE